MIKKHFTQTDKHSIELFHIHVKELVSASVEHVEVDAAIVAEYVAQNSPRHSHYIQWCQGLVKNGIPTG